MLNMLNQLKQYFMAYYVPVLTNFSIKGRASRAEFWIWFAFHRVIIFCFDKILDVIDASGTDHSLFTLSVVGLIAFYPLLVLIQEFALGIRRYHDIGKSTEYFWLITVSYMIPIFFGIFLYIQFPDGENWGILTVLLGIPGIGVNIYCLCKKGDEQPNAYGDVVKNPL